MLDLVKEGIVEVVPNKGFRVVRLSAAELDELTEIRLLLEAPTVRRLAEVGVPAADLDALRPSPTRSRTRPAGATSSRT